MKKIDPTVQTALKKAGFYKGKIDGLAGKQTDAAIEAFQTAHGLKPDGIVGARTMAALFPVETKPAPGIGHNSAGASLFDDASERNLSKAHPLLQRVIRQARKHVAFRVLDSTRGEKAQTVAYKTGKSKAKFGQSAHNYIPAVAVDLFPAPYDWNDIEAFDAMAEIIMSIAKVLGVPIRWGGDWNRDGDKTKSDAWDKPHFELDPWRKYVTPGNLVRP